MLRDKFRSKSLDSLAAISTSIDFFKLFFQKLSSFSPKLFPKLFFNVFSVISKALCKFVLLVQRSCQKVANICGFFCLDGIGVKLCSAVLVLC